MRGIRGIGLAVAGIILAGCGGGGGGGGEDTAPPTISSPAVNPARLRFPGGSVSITATVSDPAGVDRVWAILTKPDQSTEAVELVKGTNDSYQGTYSAPANTRSDGRAAAYTIYLRARDGKGNETPAPGVSAGTFQVDAPAPPPKEPDFK